MTEIAQGQKSQKTSAGGGASAQSNGAKFGSNGTNTTTSTAGTAIIYNHSNPINTDQEVFPVDRPFTLEIDSVPTNHIYHIYVYPVRSRHGTRTIMDINDRLKRDTGARASFEISSSQYHIQGNTVTLSFPPIKAEQLFDIAIIKQFSPQNLAKALYLNQFLDSHYIPDQNPGLDTVKLAKDRQTAVSLFKELLDSVNDHRNYPELKLNYLVAMKSGKPQYSPNSKVATRIDNIDSYSLYFLDPLRDVYYRLIHTTPEIGHKNTPASKNSKPGHTVQETAPLEPPDKNCLWRDAFYTQPQIQQIASLVPSTLQFHNRLFVLQNMFKYNKFDEVLTGRIRIDTSGLDKPVNPYDFNARVLNIAATYKFLDSLNNALVLWKITPDPNNKNIVKIDTGRLYTLTQWYLSDLLHNKMLLDQSGNKIKNFIETNSTENIWIIGQSTKSPDLTTLGSRRFAVTAGLTTIFAYNNAGKIICIPKPFLGVDFHLKSYDKNADFSGVLKVAPEDSSFTHLLEAKRGFLDHFSLTFGVTFGSMTNTDFTNAYGSFSFTLGPSYTIGKYVKIGAGVALIHRYDNNPLLSSTDHAVFGPYASLSIDYDLLSLVSSVTGSIFK